MKSSPRFLLWIVCAFFVLPIVLGIALAIYLNWGSAPIAATSLSYPQTPAPMQETSAFTPPVAPTPEEIKSAAVLTPEFSDPNGGPPIMPALPLQKGELPWEAQLRGVLTAPGLADAEKARRLFALMPGLAVEGRETATEQAVKLIANADYAVAQPVLLNPGTYGPALNVLFADLAERPPAIALPTLLQLARIAQHPFAPNARENLQLLLGADYGTDWNRWDAAIRAALAAPK